LLAPVGTGASADVYVADDVTLRRRVAVKILHSALAADEGFLRRFRAEARAVAPLRHPNIMTVFDWGEEEDGPFLVLEYLGGGSLRDLLDRGHRLSPSQAVLVGIEAAHGLDYAHRRGLVHRDVKPANLLFDDEGRLAIADFGIARALAEATWTEPVGAVVGTVRYASPEQARGMSLDGRADVYALALVLAEAVTGRVPFAADTTIATLMGRLDRPIPADAALGPLGPVIEAAGTVAAADRLDAAGLVRALDTAARQLPRPLPLPLAPVEQLPVTADGGDAPTPVCRATGAPVALAAALAAAAAAPAAAAPAAAPPAAAPPVEAAAEDGLPSAEPDVRRRRRWPWLIVVLAMIAAAVAGYVVVGPAVAPTYAVPSLQGDHVSDLPATPHFTVKVVHVRRTGAAVGVVLGQTPAPGTKARPGVITVTVSDGNQLVAVPSLAGLTLAQADAALKSAHLVAGAPEDVYANLTSGLVINWNPMGMAPEDVTISLAISKGPEFVTMPDVVTPKDNAAQAIAALAAVNIAATSVTQTQAYSTTVPKGDIVSTTPAAGAQADRAGTVTMVVSEGPQTVAVPNVIGDTVSEASAAITAAGLEVGGVYGGHGARSVLDQSPSAGTNVMVGSSVDLFVV